MGGKKKLQNVDLWCLVDYTNYNVWKFVFLTTDEVISLKQHGIITKNNKTASRKKLYKYLNLI
jgi:hypothetical protein